MQFPNNARGDGDGPFIPQGDMTFSMWIKTASPRLDGIQVVWGGGCDRIIGSSGRDDVFGLIDEVRIYAAPLSASDVANLYNDTR